MSAVTPVGGPQPSREHRGLIGPWRVLPSTAWVVLAVGLGVLQVLHVVVRPAGWVFEWRWAVYQYQFSTVLMAPLVAGLGAVLGRRWARARAQLATAPRGASAFAAGLVPGAAVVVGVHLLGFVSVLVRMRAVDPPSLPDLAPFLPAMAQLLAVLALGYAAGWATRSWLAAPLAALLAFAALLGGWMAGATPLVQVGGATASLVGLDVDDGVMLGQVVAYGAVATAAVTAAASRLRRGVPVAPVAAVVIGALAVLGLVRHPGDPLVPTPEALACDGGAPEICVAEPYRHLAPDLAARLRPMVDRLASAGVAPPSQLRQAFYLDLPPGVGSITQAALLGEEGSTRFALRSAYERPFCTSPEESIRQAELVVEFDQLLQQPPAPSGDGDGAGGGDRLAEVAEQLAATCTGESDPSP